MSERSSKVSGSRSSSSSSYHARLHAKAKAMQYRATADEELIYKDAEIKLFRSKAAAEEAKIEADTYQECMNEAFERSAKGSDITAQDRVQEYMSRKHDSAATFSGVTDQRMMHQPFSGMSHTNIYPPANAKGGPSEFVSQESRVHNPLSTPVSSTAMDDCNNLYLLADLALDGANHLNLNQPAFHPTTSDGIRHQDGSVKSKKREILRLSNLKHRPVTSANNVTTASTSGMVSASSSHMPSRPPTSFGISTTSTSVRQSQYYTPGIMSHTATPPVVSYVHTRGGTTVPPPDFNALNTPMSSSLTAVNANVLESLVSDCSSTNVLVAQTLAKAHLPPIECPVFKGDPTEYIRWKRTAAVNLSLPMSSAERLIRLTQFVSGEAQEIVRQYSDRFPNEAQLAYDSAWKQLDHRFGRSSVITDAILKKLSVFPSIPINDMKQLRKFASLCISIDLQIASLPGLQVLNFPVYLKPVAMKLPQDFQRKWTDHAFKLILAKQCIDYPNFAQFSDFVDKLADKLCDDTLSLKSSNTDDNSKAQTVRLGASQSESKQDKHVTNVTSSSTSDKPRWNDASNQNGKYCPVHPNFSRNRSHSLRQCKKFKELPANEQLGHLEANPDHCRYCLETGHTNCTVEIKCNKCGKRHYDFLHDAFNLTSDPTPHSYSSNTAGVSSPSAVCPAQRSYSKSDLSDSKLVDFTVLHDTGSTISLVTRELCDRLALKPVSDRVEKIKIEVLGGGLISTETKLYSIPIYDASGTLLLSVRAFSVEKIGSDLPSIDLSKAASLFGLSTNDISVSYPNAISLLIGMDNVHASISTISQIDCMILAESAMGKIIYGKHSSFAISTSSKSTYIVSVRPSELRLDLVPALFATDVIGISCTPRCGGCSCKKCPVDGAEYTLQERYEYQQIKDSMTIENGVVISSYPYVRDLVSLPDNYQLALKRLIQTESSLRRDPDRATKYQDVINDMLKRGVMRKITPEEEANWTGAIQYLPHHDVLKPGSETTPVRLVLDSSALYKGKCVNQYWGRGPCLMNDAIGILLRFREQPTAFAGDISKMYWSVHTRPQEWHLHRFLWRDMNSTLPPDKYFITVNSFGSGPAGTVAIAALNFLAERKEEEFPEASWVIQNQAFVDDIVDSVSTPADAKRVTSQIDQILSEGKMSIKKWTIVGDFNSSADSPPVEVPLQHDSVLGIHWDTNNDEFYFIPHLNFSKKKKKVRLGPDLQPGDIYDRTIVPSLTKRSLVSQVNSLYDPFGFLMPFLTELKFALAKLWRVKECVDWDTEIPADHDEHWRRLFDLFFDMKSLRFPRQLRPTTAIGEPTLLAFSDSSMIAYGAVLYIRWTLSDGSVFGRIVISKGRTWPIEPDDYLSVARGELQGVLLAKRLVATVLKHARFNFTEILYIMDSEICLAQISTSCHEFGIWTGHRVAEIRNGTDPAQFWFTNSGNNPCADLCSRGTVDLTQLDRNSLWQRGPEWMYQPRDCWPLTQQVRPTEPLPDLRVDSLSRRTLFAVNAAMTLPPPTPVPVVEVRSIPCSVYTGIQHLGERRLSTVDYTEAKVDIATFTVDQEDFIASLFDLSRIDDFDRWCNITARVLRACSWSPGDGSFFACITNPVITDFGDRELARDFWLRQAQRLIKTDIKNGKHASLTPYCDERNIIRTNGRSLQTSDYHPILLPADHAVSRLIVIAVHRRCHDGRGATANRTRAEYHILKIRRLAANVRNNCQLCILKERRLIQVPMAPLPNHRTRPSYPFEHCSCDLFGPFAIKVEGRITRSKSFDPEKLKAYGVCFSCLSTRAIHIGIMQGQDTDAFLLCYRNFIAIRGQPKTMFSDNGLQIVAAEDELRLLVDSWDLDRLRAFGAENSIEWTFCSPGSPWANGVTESLIKSIKHSLKYVLPSDTKDITVLELQTIFSEVSELLNERPIGIGSRHFTGDDFDSETNSYLCPNQLLLGRASARIPGGPFPSVNVSNANRFLAIQTLVMEWWSRWALEYLPSLVSQSKWFRSDRHSKIGDIVQVRDLNPIRGDWKIAEIISIKPNDDGIPRNVFLRYKIPYPGANYKPVPFRTQWRDVKNLSLLVAVEDRSDLNVHAKTFVPSRINSNA